MNPILLTTLKLGIGLASGAGVSFVVKNIVKATTPILLSPTEKILMSVGSFVLSAYVADQATNYLYGEIDGVISQLPGNKKTEGKECTCNKYQLENYGCKCGAMNSNVIDSKNITPEEIAKFREYLKDMKPTQIKV